MNRNEKFVITINRQFGTGGHAIGEELAKRLGVALIDRQLVSEVAQRFNITEEEALDIEKKRPSWWADFSQFYSQFLIDNTYSSDYKSITSRQLFNSQSSIMRSIAERDSCVVIGRCGFDVFEKHPNSLKVFLHAPLECRIKRIMQKYGVDELKARYMAEEHDYTREVYTRTFTGKDKYDARNYDLSVNVGSFGVNGAVDFLMKIIDA